MNDAVSHQPGGLRSLGHRSLLPLAVFVLALAALAWLWHGLEQRHLRHLQDHFEAESRSIATRIQERTELHAQLLRAAAGLFAGSDQVTGTEWRAFVERLDLPRRGVPALGYAQLLADDEQPLPEGHAGGAVRPEGRRRSQAPALFIEPPADPGGIGPDLLSEPEQAAAMAEARDRGLVAYTSRLPAAAGEGPGLLAFHPVYAPGRPLDSLDGRRAALIGWVFIPYRAAGIVGPVAGEGAGAIRLELFDGESTAPQALLYDSNPGPAAARALFSKSLHLPIEGRTWTLRFSALPGFAAAARVNPPWVEFGAILVIGALLLGITWLLLHSRRRAEVLAGDLTASLARSEERYRSLFSGAKVAMLIIDPSDGAIVDANRAASEYYGHSHERLVGMRIGDINTLSPEEVQQEMASAVREQRNHFHFRHRLASGEIREVEVHSGPIPVGDRELLYSLIHDITDRRRLQQEHRKLAQAVEQSPVSIVIADPAGNLEYVNEAFCRVTGYSRQEAIGQNPRILKSGETSDAEYRAMWDGLARGLPWSGLFHNRRKDGSLYWESARITPLFDEEGNITHYLGVKENITERKQAEEEVRDLNRRLAGLLSAATEVAIIATDADGTITVFNRGAERMLGYTAAELIGQATPLLFHGREHPLEGSDDREQFRAIVDAAGTTGRDLSEATYVRKDGSRLRVSLAITPLRSEQGSISGYLGIAHDITERVRMEQALAESETRFRSTFEQAAVGIAHIAPDGRFIRVNQSFCAITGYSRAELEAAYFLDITHPEDLEVGRDRLEELRQGRRDSQSFEKRYIRKNGVVVWCHLTLSARRDEQGRFIHFISVVEDITARHQAEERLRLAAGVFSEAHEGIIITDARGDIVDVNRAFTRITGFEHDEVLGRNPRFLQSGMHSEAFYEAMWHALIGTGEWSGELWNRRKGGEQFAEAITISAVRDEEGSVSHYIGLFSDITEKKRQQEIITHLAYYDALTQLPNRLLLGDRIRQALARAERRQTQVAVCYLDLDGFKPINDQYGHDTGDRLLVRVAQRLTATVRGQDTVARLGGDEFVLLLNDIEQSDEVELVLARVMDALTTPFVLEHGITTTISASLGVTLFPHDGSDADTLLRHADQAMYRAKQEGRSRVQLFDAEQDARARGHRELRERIRAALRDREFALWYQPKVDMHLGRVVGAEALIRWPQGDGSMVMPGQFLPAIEDDDLIIDLGEWVLRTAAQAADRWRARGRDLGVSVNVAARQLVESGFIAKLAAVLDAHPQLPPERLELEILETAALDDLVRVNGAIEACRALGVRFALDDFGTGYSSLTHFRRLPAETVKIDQSFVRDMLDDRADFAIVEGILGMTGAFGKMAVAEGVEYREHGVVLLRLGCHLAQGYAVARPMTEAAFLAWIEAFRPDPAWLIGMRSWAVDDYPLVTAALEHGRWVEELEAFAAGGREPPHFPVEEAEACRLAAWIAGRGAAWSGLRGFDAVVALHDSLRRGLADGMRLVRAGQTESAAQSIQELRAMVAEFDGAIRRLCDEQAGAVGAAAP